MMIIKKQHAWLTMLVFTALVGSNGGNQARAAEPGTPSSPYPPGNASPKPSVMPADQPPPANTGATSGWVFIGGKQAFLINSVMGNSVDKRFEDIHNRIMSVIQPGKNNTAKQITSADVTVRIVAAQPIIYLQDNAIVTVTNEDAAISHTNPVALANAWASKLKEAMSTYRVGEMLPNDWITLNLNTTEGPRIVGPQPAAGK